MIDQTNKAIIFCAHGSRDGTYNSNFLKLIKTLKSITDTENIFHCYIEKNRPLIKETINEVSQRFKQIYFYPLMFFDGYHMIKDIKQEVEYQKENKKLEKYEFLIRPYPHANDRKNIENYIIQNKISNFKLSKNKLPLRKIWQMYLLKKYQKNFQNEKKICL